MSIAVVIPVRNGARLLPDCLEAVFGQTLVPDAVIVVVGASSDATRQVVDSLAHGRVRVLDNPAGDRASGINAALELIDSDLVAMVDAQSRLAPNYLEAAAKVLEDSEIAVAGGPMRPVGAGAIGQGLAAALRSPFGVGDSQFHFEGSARDVDSVYLGVYRRSALDQVGRYNTALLRTEDDDLNSRLRAAGFRIRLDPAIRSTYRCREAIPEIWRQYFGYGYWKVALAAIRPNAIRPRHFVPMAFLAVGVIGVVIGLAGWWVPLLVLVAAWLAGAAVAAVTAPADGVGARLMLPLVAITMHSAYGAGTLLGLATFSRIRRIALDGARTAERVLP